MPLCRSNTPSDVMFLVGGKALSYLVNEEQKYYLAVLIFHAQVLIVEAMGV